MLCPPKHCLTPALCSPSVEQELRLQRTPDGFDSSDTSCCQNTWATYRALRQPFGKRGLATDAQSAPPAESACCRFGAPLVATALQRLGVLSDRVDAAAVTPAALPALPLADPAIFARAVPVRTLGAQ